MIKKNLLSLLLIGLFPLTVLANNSSLIEDLSSEQWQFRKSGTEKWYPAIVPGSVHTDLLRNRFIPEPYRDNNELEMRWIEQENWDYQCSFNVSSSLLEKDKIELNFYGIDTYATIYLNGEELGCSNNMFRKWSFDVQSFLKTGKNTLLIHFESPLNYNKEQASNYPLQLPSGNETVDLKVSPFTRKATYQFGWDWAPRFVGCGIWKGVEIEAWKDIRIVNAFCETLDISDSEAKMRLEVEIESQFAKGHYELKFAGERRPIKLEAGSNILSFEFKVADPELWWPNGLGEPHLHEMKIQILESGFSREDYSLDYGIRTVELINEVDSIGTSFYFKVNGHDIFMKGSNYVPQDIFLERVQEKDYKRILKQVKNANMNMLRVWGGGIYEKEIFYELCDQYGIMIWQDFMFANSLYPSAMDFKLNIVQEIIENVNRLKKHPCIALWCGNNEIEVAWGNWGWQNQYAYSYSDSVTIWNNQLEIFHHLIPDLLHDLYPSANYTPTSPLSNWGTPENFNHSSMHYWGVWHGKEPFINFKTNVGRFMVEYGFQSFPDYEYLNEVIHDTNMKIDSPTMKNRQKSYIGNGLITHHTEGWFGKAESFEDFLINSQKTQALALRTAIMQHRLHSPHCMGTLFWQLNDCWQGPSWSVINYDGSEKIGYDVVKDWFANTVVIPQVTENQIEFYVNTHEISGFNGELELTINDKNLKYQLKDIKPNKTVKLDKVIDLTVGDLEIKLTSDDKKVWKTKIPAFLLL